MTAQTPATLKGYFNTGDVPTEAQFSDLIDSFELQAAYHVKDYGAVGDGATDDTTAIQAAINACPENGMVVFEGKTYRTTAALTVSKHFVSICGQGMAMLSLLGTGNVLEMTGHDCLIENLYLTSNHANAGGGLYVNGGYHLRLKRVYIAGVQYHACSITGAWNVLTTDCLFDAGQSDAGYAGFYFGANSNAVTHVRSRFYAGGNIGADVVTGSSIVFRGCTIEGDTGGIGIRLDAPNSVSIDGCYFEALGLYGIQVGNTNRPVGTAISNNYFYVTQANAIAVRIVQCQGCLMENNFFYGTAPTGSIGISIDGTTILARDIKISNSNTWGGTSTTIDDAVGRADNWNGESYLQRRVSFSASAPRDGGLWAKGSFVLNTAPASGSPIGWICTHESYAVKEQWAASRSYITGDFISGYMTWNIYRAQNTATSGSTEPTHTSGSASDGAVIWSWQGTAAGYGGIATFASIGNLP